MELYRLEKRILWGSSVNFGLTSTNRHGTHMVFRFMILRFQKYPSHILVFLSFYLSLFTYLFIYL